MVEKYLVVDVHHHYMPESVTKMMSQSNKGYSQGQVSRQVGNLQKVKDIESRLRFMDEAGIDIAVLEQSPSAQGLEMCREMNNGYAKIIQGFPERFIACTHVPLECNTEILKELDRATNELGFRCISLVTSTAKFTLDSPELFPLWEKISHLDIPIFMHPTVRSPLWGGEKYSMSTHISREYEIIKATIEVLYGVLPKFPDLKFVMPHFGGGMPALKGRIMAWFEPKGSNIPDGLRGLPKTPRELKETGLEKTFEEEFGKLYFDTAGFGGWQPITEAATKVIRSDRICFGTDFPYEIHEAQDIKGFITSINQLSISEDGKQNILGGNVKRLLKL
jgi:predicted TIM-barrel fold metal-dependent hydrolase